MIKVEVMLVPAREITDGDTLARLLTGDYSPTITYVAVEEGSLESIGRKCHLEHTRGCGSRLEKNSKRLGFSPPKSGELLTSL